MSALWLEPETYSTTEVDVPRFVLEPASFIVQREQTRWRVRGLLPEIGIAALFGPSASGKSFLALDLLGSIASGAAWYGHRVRAAPAVYVGLEGLAGIANRVRAYERHYQPLPDSFTFMLGQPFSLVEADDVLALAEAIREACGDDRPVVAIDTLAQAAPGLDENGSSDMGRIIASAKELQRLTGGLVLLIHHAGKNTSKGMRGHSSLFAALDAVIEVSRDDDRREWRVSKSKDGEDGRGHPFALRVVELGEDDDGEAITSCVVEPEERHEAQARRLNLPKGGNQKIIYDALLEILRDSNRFGMADAPSTRPCVELEQATIQMRDRLTCEGKRRTERTREALTGLVNRGVIVLREGWIWLP